MSVTVTPYSNLKVFAHYERLGALNRGEHVSPVYVRLKPTNVCNHHCYYCSYADKDLALRDAVNSRDQIPWAKMQELLADFSSMGVKAVTLSGGGEPLVYPHIAQLIEKTLSYGIHLSVITNGQNLKNETAEALTEAKWVRISFDAATAETYAGMRRIPERAFSEVCENIRNFALAKPAALELGVNFVVNHMNAGEVFEAASLVRDLGANHIKFSARVTKDLYNYHAAFRANTVEQIHKAIDLLSGPCFKIINKYEDDFLSCTVFKRSYSKCYIKHLVTTIAADSKLYFCHDKAYVSSGVVGDLKDRSFKELWFAPETGDRYLNFDAEKECRHHCVFDDRNVLLNTFFSLDQNHINFI